MSEHTYKKVEVVGSSSTSIEDAVNIAIAKVAETETDLRWAEVLETRCHLQDSKVAYWQVTVKVGCRA